MRIRHFYAKKQEIFCEKPRKKLKKYIEDLKTQSQDVVFVAKNDGENFMCLMADGSVDFLELDSSHPKVVEYEGNLQKKYSCELKNVRPRFKK